MIKLSICNLIHEVFAKDITQYGYQMHEIIKFIENEGQNERVQRSDTASEFEVT